MLNLTCPNCGLRNAAEITAYAVKLGLYDPT